MSEEKQHDLAYGMPAIAQHLGLKVAQARYLAAKGTIPTFKVGKMTCARRSSLDGWIVACEQHADAEPASPKATIASPVQAKRKTGGGNGNG